MMWVVLAIIKRDRWFEGMMDVIGNAFGSHPFLIMKGDKIKKNVYEGIRLYVNPSM